MERSYVSELKASGLQNMVLGGSPGQVNQYSPLNEEELADIVIRFHREYEKLNGVKKKWFFIKS